MSIVCFPLVAEFISYYFHSIIFKPFKKRKYKNFLGFIKFKHLRYFVKEHFKALAIIYFFLLVLVIALSQPQLIESKQINTQKYELVGEGELQKLETTPDVPYTGLESYNNIVIEVGCYTCNYTQLQLHEIRPLENIQYMFIGYPHSEEEVVLQQKMACIYLVHNEVYWKVHSYLLDYPVSQIDSLVYLFNINTTSLEACETNKLYEPLIEKYTSFVKQQGVSRIPTLFVNDHTIQGLSTTEEIQAILD